MSQAAADYTTKIEDHELKLSEAAAQQFAALMSQADEEILGIRIFVSGGGCGGMSYGMTYTDQISDFDKVHEGDGYKIMVDSVALNYLQGCDIDFVDQGLNKSFVFNNVFQAVGGSGACGGCGASGGGGCG